MEIVEIDVTAFLQALETIATVAFYTVSFIGVALVVFTTAVILIGESK